MPPETPARQPSRNGGRASIPSDTPRSASAPPNPLAANAPAPNDSRKVLSGKVKPLPLTILSANSREFYSGHGCDARTSIADPHLPMTNADSEPPSSPKHGTTTEMTQP